MITSSYWCALIKKPSLKISLATLIVLSGCGSEPQEKVDDAAADVTDEERCYIHCGGGWSCREGEISVDVFGDYPCGAGTWPELCSTDAPTYTCESGVCDGEVDARYSVCMWNASRAEQLSVELAKLTCAEGQPKLAADACQSDEDCRPAAESVAGALECDTGAGECVEVLRPEAPEGYGGTCGLAPGSVSIHTELATGPTCALCHVRRDDEAGCVRQACTIECTFDEDCPASSICLCSAGLPTATGFCAEATDRSTSDGREAWLGCSAS